MPFDQEEFLRLITDHYEFCHRVYWNDLPISRALLGGWPEIPPEVLAGLQKNDGAVNLIRNLPYPEFSRDRQYSSFTPLLMFDTQVIDYRLDYVQESIVCDELESKPEPFTTLDPPLPASCVCIARCYSRNGYFVVVDTEDGYVYWGDPNGEHDEPEPELKKTLERFEDDDVNDWRVYGVNVYTPADFFALCKHRFREMRWIGTGHWYISAVRMNIDSDNFGFERGHDVMVGLLREAGWPGDGEGRDWDPAKFHALLENARW
ncbi:hypothetical protein HYQ45_016451 [Verticillium longisporum]